MIGKPTAYLNTSVLNKDELVRAYHDHRAFELLNKTTIPDLMEEMGLRDKARVAAIVERRDGDEWVVISKIITHKGSALHEERWEEFPSDLFKTKLLMVCS